MMRKIAENDNKKELKIITKMHKVLMSSKDNIIEIQVNDNKYQVKADEIQEISEGSRVIIRIVAMGPYVKVEFPVLKLYVYFDGYAANIKLSRLYMRDQCGLCGHFDNEQTDEFRKPNFELEKDVRQFYSAWILKEPAGCTVPEISSICQDGRCTFKPFLDIDDDGRDPEKVQLNEKPQKKTKVMEIDSDICFSVEPISQCPLRTYPKQKETKQVQFVCFNRDDEEAEQFSSQLRTQDIIQLNKPATGIRNLDIPIKCAPLI